jgi:hypothetical protein
MQVLNHTPTQPSEFRNFLLRVGQPGRDLTQQQVRIIDGRDPPQLVRHAHTS